MDIFEMAVSASMSPPLPAIIIKLVNGDLLIAFSKECEDQNYVLLRQPRRIEFKETQNKGKKALFFYSFIISEIVLSNDFMLNKKQILGVFVPSQKMFELYGKELNGEYAKSANAEITMEYSENKPENVDGNVLFVNFKKNANTSPPYQTVSENYGKDMTPESDPDPNNAA